VLSSDTTFLANAYLQLTNFLGHRYVHYPHLGPYLIPYLIPLSNPPI